MTSKGPEHGNHGVVLTEHPFFKIKCLCVQAKQSMYVLWQLIIVPSKRTIVRLLSARGSSRTADMEQRRVEPMHIVGVLAILCVLTQLLLLCQLPAYALYLPLHISCWLFQSVKHRLNSKLLYPSLFPTGSNVEETSSVVRVYFGPCLFTNVMEQTRALLA